MTFILFQKLDGVTSFDTSFLFNWMYENTKQFFISDPGAIFTCTNLFLYSFVKNPTLYVYVASMDMTISILLAVLKSTSKYLKVLVSIQVHTSTQHST